MCAISEAVQQRSDWAAQSMLPGKSIGEVPHHLSRVVHHLTEAHCMPL